MFLTVALFRKGISGKQWIGKYRRPRHVTWQMKRNMVARLEAEAENEYWLSRPFMSAEQERGHAAERRMRNWLQLKESQAGKLPEHRFIAEHLAHLNTTKNWSSQ